jgi:hypothetical protein
LLNKSSVSVFVGNFLPFLMHAIHIFIQLILLFCTKRHHFIDNLTIFDKYL